MSIFSVELMTVQKSGFPLQSTNRRSFCHDTRVFFFYIKSILRATCTFSHEIAHHNAIIRVGILAQETSL